VYGQKERFLKGRFICTRRRGNWGLTPPHESRGKGGTWLQKKHFGEGKEAFKLLDRNVVGSM